MVKSTIEKSGTVYEFTNFQSLSFDLDATADVIPLIDADETDTSVGLSEKAILTKFFGNILRIAIEWVISDEASSVVTGTGGIVKTTMEQLKYLLRVFEPKSVNPEYTYKIYQADDVTVDFQTTCLVTRITLVKTGDEPVTFKATIQAIVGDVIG